MLKPDAAVHVFKLPLSLILQMKLNPLNLLYKLYISFFFFFYLELHLLMWNVKYK